MNKSFIVFDKLNSVAFECHTLVSFNFENSDYLVYYLLKSNSKCGIFISKLVKEKEGQYSLFDISKTERDKLDGICYNVFVSLPSSFTADSDINKFVNDFCFNNNIIFLKNIPDLNDQLLCSNSNLSDSTLEYSEYVGSFYDAILPKVNILPPNSTLVWNLPSKNFEIRNFNTIDNNTTIPVEHGNSSLNFDSNNIIYPNFNGTTLSSQPVFKTYNESNDLGTSSINKESNSVVSNSNGGYTSSNINDTFNNSNVLPIFVTNSSYIDSNGSNYNYGLNVSNNNQKQVINNNQNSFEKVKKNAGFASNMYIIIGTVCFVLSLFIITIFIIFVNRL